jgi:hypothetical protein
MPSDPTETAKLSPARPLVELRGMPGRLPGIRIAYEGANREVVVRAKVVKETATYPPLTTAIHSAAS